MMNTFTLKIVTVSLTLGFTSLFAQAPPVPFAGNGTIGFSGDGGQAINAQLNYISSFCGDGSGNIYISDFSNSDIRKVDASGIISTVAGNQVQGFSGDGGLATVASLSVTGGFGSPTNLDIAKDAAGNLYINDFGNYRIRKVSTSGTITTIAGTGVSGNSGNGAMATLAQINATNLTADALGNVYFSDRTNHVVRKINTSGIISIVAGNGTSGFSGDGGQGNLSQIDTPGSIVVDAAGNLYISDIFNNRIRIVNPSGIISTYAGNGTSSYTGDGGLATSAAVCPTALAISPLTGNLVFVSMSNQSYQGSLYGKCNIRTVIGGNIVTVKDSSYFLMGVSQYVQNIRSFYIDGSLNMYFSPDYNVCVGFCSPGNCYKTSLNNTSTGIEALDFDNKLIQVFPNPSNGNFTIENKLNDKSTMELTDISGKLIHSQSLSNSKSDFNLNLPAGNYNVSINANGVVVNKRVIITK